MIIMGIESSCDETACGIVDDQGKVLANELYSQIKEHTEFGGVVPEIAARAHLEKIGSIVSTALKKSGLDAEDVDMIAYTRGPGLMGPLLVGANFAKGLAADMQKDLVGINHLEGHIAAAEMSYPDLKPPYLALTVSGGHTEISLAEKDGSFTLLGRTRDDAAGEAFDKCGKLLGLGYPAGPVVSRTAEGGNRKFHRFPRALRSSGLEFSFSGLKTAVLRYVEEMGPDFIRENIQHVCASLEAAIVDILVEKSVKAIQEHKVKDLAICGGVSANRFLRTELEKAGKKYGFRACFPEFSLCTDNGAMIAGAAHRRIRFGTLEESGDRVQPSLSLSNS